MLPTPPLLRRSVAVVMDCRIGCELVIIPEINPIHVKIGIVLKAHFAMEGKDILLTGNLDWAILHIRFNHVNREVRGKLDAALDLQHFKRIGVDDNPSFVPGNDLPVRITVNYKHSVRLRDTKF